MSTGTIQEKESDHGAPDNGGHPDWHADPNARFLLADDSFSQVRHFNQLHLLLWRAGYSTRGPLCAVLKKQARGIDHK
jgi:hypothetical protein